MKITKRQGLFRWILVIAWGFSLPLVLLELGIRILGGSGFEPRGETYNLAEGWSLYPTGVSNNSGGNQHCFFETKSNSLIIIHHHGASGGEAER